MSEATDEKIARTAFAVLAGAAVLLLTGHLAMVAGCRHEFTTVESVVAMHATMLASGEGLYYDLQSYPYTVSPYGPIFYALNATLCRGGAPFPLAGRLLSFAALLGILALIWRLLRLTTANRHARWFGFLAAATSPQLAFWGTVGQVDTLGVFFSLAAFTLYLEAGKESGKGRLVWVALLLLAAVFTKQTMAASGAAIVLLLWRTDRRRAILFAGAAAAGAAALAWALNSATGGRYFDNAVVANMNPFSLGKAWSHAVALAAGAGCLLVLTAAGFRRATRERIPPLFVYLGCSLAVLAFTAPKLGSDLNYQIETTILLGLTAAWTLDRAGFSPAWFRGEIVLLGLLPVIQLALNLTSSGKLIAERWGYEQVRRAEMARLERYLRPDGGRVLSVQLDPLLQARRRIEMDPFIYRVLVETGVVDPEPVRRDLAHGKFAAVILFDDLTRRNGELPLEIPSLSAAQLDEVRKRYRLMERVPGPYQNGDYVYVPIEKPLP